MAENTNVDLLTLRAIRQAFSLVGAAVVPRKAGVQILKDHAGNWSAMLYLDGVARLISLDVVLATLEALAASPKPGRADDMRGVYPHNGRWQARYSVGRRLVYVGSFASPEEARDARKAAKEHARLMG